MIPTVPLCLMPRGRGAASGAAGAGVVEAEPQPGREDGADNPPEFNSHIQSRVGEGDHTRCPCALPLLLRLGKCGRRGCPLRPGGEVQLMSVCLSWPSLPLLQLAPSSGALAKGIGMCVGLGSACLLQAWSVGVQICWGSRSQRPGAWAAQALVSAPWLLAKTCTRATEQVGLVCLIFLPWCLQPQLVRLAGGRRCPRGPVPPRPTAVVGWGRDRPWPGVEGKAVDVQPAKAHASVFAMPKFHEGVAAEITLQEHPFPPYLPSRTRYVAYIKVDALLLPSLLP